MAYFDNAATTFPKPEAVYTFMSDFYRSNGASAGRGNYGASLSAGALIAETRQLLQELLHCQAKQVVFTPTATIALNIVLQGLVKMGVKEVYISPFEHNAVTRTLHAFEVSGQVNVHKLVVSKNMVYDLERIRYQFEEKRPDLIVVSHASNVFGLISPVEEIFRLGKQFDAYTVVDMAQTAGLVDCNVGSNVIDFAVFAGHKTLYGPTGISGFMMKPEIKLPAVIFGGTGYESANQDMPLSLPERYEMGTMNLIGVAGLHAALKWINDICSLQMFTQPLLGRANDFLAATKIDDKGVRDLTAPTIRELIKRGRCICGAEIRDGNDAYKHLMEELNYVPPESIGNTVRHYREKLNSFSRNADHTYDSLTSRYQEVYRSKARIQEWEDELADISVQIKGKENMKQYEVELTDVKKRLRDLNDKKERLIRDDATLKNDIERYKKVYDSLVAVSGKNKETMLFIQYAEEILDWLSTTYKEKEAFIRDALETKVNHIFEQMYHGHRRVSIDQRYQVTLLTTIEDKEVAAGESEGSNRVKSFAFIAGLVALAKEKLIANAGEEGFNLSSEPYPLVMDAPFSNADETHTANISKVLPEIAEQVIMFVMQKDWRYAEPVMASRVGKQYTLKKQSETHTILE